ncbi:hypothetical protein FB567DRAFT_132270 [Paraphoma chrysanthemicola]|uniref:Uncharacterized protein n=1 Tax=Paraphoma chrysanthemicola TaxID=798071 RepID=A0A8K0R0D8_9PLEO|nr:hypothetical protein FB567DRAFT_132270 [Paraphoma chrysanthemicola]
MQDRRHTPPYSDPDTPIIPPADPATPTSLASSTVTAATILNTNPTPTIPSKLSLKQATTSTTAPTPPLTTPTQRPPIPETLTQALVESNSALKRLQQDLLILTSFPDNSSLLWRPPWFPPGPHTGTFWTLHNPPNVVTERITNPSNPLWVVYTRRMRRESDPEPAYIKSWTQWARVCEIYGIPGDFLGEGMVALVRLGLRYDAEGGVLAPRNWPLYPEPQIPGQRAYALDPARCATHLPPRFSNLITEDHGAGFVEQVEVGADGTLSVLQREEYVRSVADRRWSWVPWTREQETSCAGLKVRVRGWNGGIKRGGSGVESKRVEGNEEDDEEGRRVKRARSLV